MTIWFMSVKRKAINSYAGATGINWDCPEATGHNAHSLQRPEDECGGSEG